ncbi:MAG TPA: hypothetical protein PK740_02240, partial [Bacteroidales bacterium]|nr:hypothetical protein [Bacteroidales bacterium]
MKTKVLIPMIAVSLLVTSCKLSELSYYDDVYTSSSDAQYHRQTVAENSEYIEEPQVETSSAENSYNYEEYNYSENNGENLGYSSSETYYDNEDGNTYVTNNYYYDEDDYYDYYYTSRIRRFHHDYNCGWGYYDPYYTNLYWYDNSPSNWGISIYLGYNWWWP